MYNKIKRLKKMYFIFKLKDSKRCIVKLKDPGKFFNQIINKCFQRTHSEIIYEASCGRLNLETEKHYCCLTSYTKILLQNFFFNTAYKICVT